MVRGTSSPVLILAHIRLTVKWLCRIPEGTGIHQTMSPWQIGDQDVQMNRPAFDRDITLLQALSSESLQPFATGGAARRNATMCAYRSRETGQIGGRPVNSSIRGRASRSSWWLVCAPSTSAPFCRRAVSDCAGLYTVPPRGHLALLTGQHLVVLPGRLGRLGQRRATRPAFTLRLPFCSVSFAAKAAQHATGGHMTIPSPPCSSIFV